MSDAWIPDDRYRRSFGPYEMVSLRARSGGPSAHLLTFGDGRGIRVLPDERSSGRLRNLLLGEAMEAIGAIRAVSGDLLDPDSGLDPVKYMVGVCQVSGFKWESVGDERDWWQEWLTDWFEDNANSHDTGEQHTAQFTKDLAKAGWVVVRKEDG